MHHVRRPKSLFYLEGGDHLLLEDESHVIKWLSQYGALPKTQLLRMLRKPPRTAEKILDNLKRDMRIADRIMEYEGSGGIRGMIRDGLIDEEFIANVRAHGVSNEQYLAAAYNLKSGHLMQDMGNATRMLKRRMVGVSMHNTEGRSDVAALIDRALAADKARRAEAANSQGEGGEA